MDYTTNTTLYSPPAFPGMLADIGFKDTITLPAATVIKFGTAVGFTGAAPARKATNALGAACIGIAMQDHTLGGGWNPNGPVDGYNQFDPVSVLKKGRIWVLAAGTCTEGALAKFNAAGLAIDSGTALPGARFVTGDYSFNSQITGIETQRLVQVELADPTVDAIA